MTLQAVKKALTKGELLGSLAGLVKKHGADKLLDARDHQKFDSLWVAANQDVEAAANAEGSEDSAYELSRLAYAAAFKATGNGELAAYISDDFELLGRALATNTSSGFLSSLWSAYASGDFPRHPLKRVRGDLSALVHGFGDAAPKEESARKGSRKRVSAQSAFGTMAVGRFSAAIECATFRRVIDNGEGVPGWEFDVRSVVTPVQSSRSLLSGRPIRFYSEGDPIPLPALTDLTGTVLRLKEPFDPVSGEVYFTIYIFEHLSLTNLVMKFIQRLGKRYRMQVTATIPAGTLSRRSCRLRIDTWILQQRATRYG